MTAAIFGLSPGQLRLALDHRCDRQQLVRRDVQLVRTPDLLGAEAFPKGGQLLGHQPAHGSARLHVVGSGKQEAFEVRRIPATRRR